MEGRFQQNSDTLRYQIQQNSDTLREEVKTSVDGLKDQLQDKISNVEQKILDVLTSVDDRLGCMERKVLDVSKEGIVLHWKDEETVRMVLAEDTLVLEQSEAILNACLDKESMDGSIMMFEPRSHDADIGKE